MAQRKRQTRAMRIEGHKPSGESHYALKRRRRVTYARNEGCDPSTPWPVMGIQNSALMHAVEAASA